MSRFRVERINLVDVFQVGHVEPLRADMLGYRWRSVCPACPSPGHTYHDTFADAWASVDRHRVRHYGTFADALAVMAYTPVVL